MSTINLIIRNKRLLIILGIVGLLLASPFIFATFYNTVILKKPLTIASDIDQFLNSQVLGVAATVNDEKILKSTVATYTKKYNKNEKDTLDLLVYFSVVDQKAKSEKVVATEEEVNEQMDQWKRQFTREGISSLEEGFKKQNISHKVTVDLIHDEEIRTILAYKILGIYTVTEQDIRDYIKKNNFSKDEDESQEEFRFRAINLIRFYRAVKYNEQHGYYSENLKKNADIKYYVKY